jgi:tetratricopeptide (TPR) repeat protein
MMLFVDGLVRGERRRTWLAHVANFLVAAAYLSLRAVLFHAPLGGNYVRPMGINLLTQACVSLSYLGKMFYPFRLNVCPDFSLSTGLWDPRAIIAIVIIMALLLAAFLCRSKCPLVSLAVFWYFMALAPSSLIPLKRIVNEHNIYLPSVGYAIGMSFLYVRLRNFKPGFLTALFLLMAISFIPITIVRNRAWQAEENLWRASIRFTPHTILPRVHLGNIYYNSGRFSSGVCIYRSLSADEPETAIFKFRLGIGLFETGQYPEAERSLREAIHLDPKLAEAYEYLGHVYLVTGRPQDAVEAYRTVKAKGFSTPTISHNFSLALLALGKSLQAQSGCEAARTYYEQAANEDPSNIEVKTLLQNCLLNVSPGTK